MPIGLNGQGVIVRYNGTSPDEVVARPAVSLLSAEERAYIEALPDQSPLKQAYMKSDAITAAGGGTVTSVAGRTGAVNLTKTDVGLPNVDNTSDLAKPVSTAVTTALAGKQPLLASGVSIKTVNGTSLLGAGNIEVAAGGGSGLQAISGVTYNGSSQVTGFTKNAVAYTVTYPNSTSIVISGNGVVTTITLDGSARVVAVTHV